MSYVVIWRNACHRFVSAAIIVLLLFLVGGCAVKVYSFFNWQLVILPRVFSWNEKIPRVLLWSAIPLLAWADDEVEMPVWQVEDESLLILQSAIPLLARVKVTEEAAPAITGPLSAPEESQAADSLRSPSLTGDCLVIIYHTHTGETYTLTDGMDRLQGKRGGVVAVGEAIKDTLESNYGIKVVHSDKIHDTQYAVSYRESEKTLRKLLSAHPKVRVALDIHRDAGRSRKNSLVRVEGQEVAPILFIVGSDARLPFPTWKENYRFARELAARLDKKYPGLCLGVRVGEGRYNQFLHSGSLLAEIGSASNSTEEAVASARLFAGVLGKTIQEMINQENKG
jgi:stage II sporulation protein P